MTGSTDKRIKNEQINSWKDKQIKGWKDKHINR